MPDPVDGDCLRDDQYRTSANLAARISLHERYSTNPQPFARWAFEQLELPGEAEILEVGCGTGLLWQLNADRLPRGWSLTLTDFSAGMLDTARSNCADLPVPVTFELADVQALPYAEGSFDAVVANFMLYHVADRRTAFAELHRVLRPGGKLFAATNGSAHLREIREWERRFGITTLFGATQSAVAFGLQNGASQMEPWFEVQDCLRREDALQVPSPDPILHHIRSKMADPDEDAIAQAALRNHLERLLDLEGSLHVTKASGMFVALRKEL